MNKFELRPITENSWILLCNGDRSGMVFLKNDTYTTMGVKLLTKNKYSDLEELETALGGKLTVEDHLNDNTLTDEVGDISGYPIKHSIASDIQTDSLPSYKKAVNSDIRYAAGYYGLMFNNGWVNSFCPKLATLTQYQYIGPFKTKFELNHAISCENNKPEELSNG